MIKIGNNGDNVNYDALEVDQSWFQNYGRVGPVAITQAESFYTRTISPELYNNKNGVITRAFNAMFNYLTDPARLQ